MKKARTRSPGFVIVAIATGMFVCTSGTFGQQQKPADKHTLPMSALGRQTNASEPVITLFYGKHQSFRTIGVPQRWANILGNVSDPDGIRSLTYSLNNGMVVTLSVGPDTRRLQNPGDFNIDLAWSQLDPLPDSNQVVLTATDALAHVRTDTVIVTYSPGTEWPIPYTVSWSAAGNIEKAGQIVDGLWTRDGGGVRIVDTGYDRLIALGDTSWTNYDVVVPITIHGIDPSGYTPTSGQPAVGLFLRWLGHTDDPVVGWQPKSGWRPSGALGMYAFYAPENGGERLEIWQKIADGSGKKLQFGQSYYFRMRVQTQGLQAFYALRVWPANDPEPEQWDLMYLDSHPQTGRGSLLLLAHHVDATFGNVDVLLPDPLPVQLVRFTGTALNSQRVQLSWQTLGETANYGFEVEKAAREPRGFQVIAGSFMAGHGTTIQPHEYSYTDSGATPGIWYYRLRQIDLDGSVAYHEAIQIPVGDVTSVSDRGVPTDDVLEQNFPNPFNPATTITYALPGPGSRWVRLAVYDLLGREVKTLVNGTMQEGSHSVTWDGRERSGVSAPSGMYVYRLQADGVLKTKRMLLLK